MVSVLKERDVWFLAFTTISFDIVGLELYGERCHWPWELTSLFSYGASAIAGSAPDYLYPDQQVKRHGAQAGALGVA